MDPLSISASVAGLVTLAGVVLSNGSAYIKSVQEFPKALENLLKETTRLNSLLRQIDELAQATGKLSEVITQDVIDNAGILLRSVKTKLEDCQRVHSHGTKGKHSVKKAIIWPFKEREVNTTLEDFRRLITTLDQALTVDSKYFHPIYNNINSALGLTNPYSRTLHEIYDVSEEVRKRTREIADEQECLYTVGPLK